MSNPMPAHGARERWRRTQLAAIEPMAYREIMRFERKFGAITTPVIPVDRFLEDLWGLRYVHCDPTLFGIPTEAQGGLRPDLRKVIISETVTHRGQQNMVKLHEGCHWLKHVPMGLRVNPDQIMLLDGTSLPAGAPTGAWYCRGEACYQNGKLEEPYMYREAEFFGACMLLPRDRFAPRAERRIHQAWREQHPGYTFPRQEWFRHTSRNAVITIVDRAVEFLYEQHEEEVSKSVIRIRLSEVGLAPEYAQRRFDEPARMREVMRGLTSRLFATEHTAVIGSTGGDEVVPWEQR